MTISLNNCIWFGWPPTWRAALYPEVNRLTCGNHKKIEVPISFCSREVIWGGWCDRLPSATSWGCRVSASERRCWMRSCQPPRQQPATRASQSCFHPLSHSSALRKGALFSKRPLFGQIRNGNAGSLAVPQQNQRDRQLSKWSLRGQRTKPVKRQSAQLHLCRGSAPGRESWLGHLVIYTLAFLALFDI